jgi:hypothetical protein
MSIQFEFLDTNAVLSNVTPDGVRYLELFLKEYSRITGTPESNLNAGCNNCISEYMKTYKLNKNKMASTKNYRLKEKYNGIPLKFGSNTYVSNSNITDEYAEILLEKHKAEDIFEVYPKKKTTVKATETPVTETATEVNDQITDAVTQVETPKTVKKATSKKIKK